MMYLLLSSIVAIVILFIVYRKNPKLVSEIIRTYLLRKQQQETPPSPPSPPAKVEKKDEPFDDVWNRGEPM